MRYSKEGAGDWVCRCVTALLLLGASAGVTLGLERTSRPRPRPSPPPLTVQEDANQILQLADSRIRTLDVRQQSDRSLIVPIEIDGRLWTLELRKHAVRSADFQVLVQREPFAAAVPAEAPPVVTYRGTILELPGSRVAGSVVDGHLNAMIRTSDGVFGVQSLADLGVAAGAGEHVVYRTADLRPDRDYRCGATDAHQAPWEGTNDASGRVAGTGLEIADLAIDADVEFYLLNGASVPNTVHDIENVLNTVEFIYERDVAITYEVTTILVRTVEPDPYTSSDPDILLNQFTSEWQSGDRTFIRRDTAHLFTGKNMDENIIGIAFLGVVCSSNLAYGLSESRFSAAFASRAALTAHEIGHNWNAGHCDGDPNGCHIMCSGLGGCNGISGSNLKFGPTEQQQIENFRDTRSCIGPLADPQVVPFFDDFASTALSLDRWSYLEGVFVSDLAVAEPSGPFSLNLDTAGSQPFRDDEIRSNAISLQGVEIPKLSYHTQHRGVDAGEPLVVEYWNNDFAWVELNRIVSDGVDQDAFDYYEHFLPADARHSEFRVRFRTEVNSIGDDWYLDDVFLRGICNDASQCDDGVFCNGAEQCVAEECAAGPNPCGPTEGCNEAFQHCFDPALCEPPTLSGDASRFVGITSPAGGPRAHFVVPPCDLPAGRYAGPPSGDDNTAQLVSDPADAAFLTPAEWNGPVYVAGAGIDPSQSYGVRSNCGTLAVPVWSDTATVTTVRFGDVAGLNTGGVWSPPDGAVNVTQDVIAILDAFRSLPTAPPVYRADMIGFGPGGRECGADAQIDIVDATLALDAFRGRTFHEATGCPLPTTCP